MELSTVVVSSAIGAIMLVVGFLMGWFINAAMHRKDIEHVEENWNINLYRLKQELLKGRMKRLIG